jgi:hypothetical protein
MVRPLWPADRDHSRIWQIKIEKKMLFCLTNERSVTSGAAIRVKLTENVDTTYSFILCS